MTAHTRIGISRRTLKIMSLMAIIGVIALQAALPRTASAVDRTIGLFARFYYPLPYGSDRDAVPVGDDVRIVLYFYAELADGPAPATLQVRFSYPDGAQVSTNLGDWTGDPGKCTISAITANPDSVDITLTAGADWGVSSNACILETDAAFSTPGVKQLRNSAEGNSFEILTAGHTAGPFEDSEAVITVVNTDEPTPTPTPGAEPTPPAECQLDPDMALTPEAISLAAGGRTTVTVTLRNLCNDAPLSGNDLLLSLSDGLRIVGGSNGLVNLGQRGAFQGFTLSGGETRSFIFEVEAASTLTVAPLHVAELYRVGRVARRIDGVFVGATVAAPAPAVEAAPAPIPAEPAAPAPLPVALPNTAGEESVLLLVALLGLGAVGIGYRTLKRR